MVPDKPLLIAEFLLLFVMVPVIFRFLPMNPSPLPALWMVAIYCLLALRRDRGFDSARLWNAAPLRRSLPSMLAIFAVVAVVMAVVVWRTHPERLFGLVRAHPLFWAALMVLYPLLSVYAQGIIYRAFFFERYRPLFSATTAMIVASAAMFGFSHIIFRNYWSVALTLAAGLLFAWRYEVTGSLLVSSLEHALYGCYVFSVGLGWLFYHGAGRAVIER